MREILFRGKSVADGEWLYGDLTQVRLSILNKEDTRYGMENTMMLSMCEMCDTSLSGFSEQQVIPETVGQYTGIEDKNGVKIFEGDILKVKTMWNVKVEYEDDAGISGGIKKQETYWSVEYKNYSTEMGFMVFGIDRRFHKPLTWSRIYNAEAEVVGNIYDNPELMKGEEEYK